jgi:phosphatidate cytidylyltransferase
MLAQRVVTAVVLLAVLLPTLLAPAVWPFASVTLLLIGAAGWEWARLNGCRTTAAVVTGVLLAALGGAWLSLAGTPGLPSVLWWCAAGAWVLGGAYTLRKGVAGWPVLAQPLRWAIGVAVLAVAWLSLVEAKAHGINFLLSVFVLVWVADIAAYFGGRAFGKRKLAPAISPGKSWEGVFSGMAGVALLAGVWVAVEQRRAVDSPSLYAHLLDRVGVVGLGAGVALLTAMSVVGDLFESLVKRAAGAKDSSRLLPGHGGVLDRIDALLPVFPLALALSSV